MYIESIEEARIYNFYGDIEPIEEGVIDALKGFVENIKKAIVKLIEKLEDLLSKGTDNKFKSNMRSLLSRAKAALKKSDSISSKEEAIELKKEAEEIKDEMSGISPEFKEAVESGNLLRARIMIKDSMLIDKTFWTSDSMAKYAKNKGLDVWEPDDDNERRVITSEDALNTEFVAFIHNFSKLRYNTLKRGIIRLYLKDNTESSNQDDDDLY